MNAERSEIEQLVALADWQAPQTEAACWHWLEVMDQPIGSDYTSVGILAPQVIARLAQNDPAATFRRLWESEGLRRRESYLAELMQAWVKLDAPSA